MLEEHFRLQVHLKNIVKSTDSIPELEPVILSQNELIGLHKKYLEATSKLLLGARGKTE